VERDISPRAAEGLGAPIVDVREPYELVEDGRVAGAVNIPLGELSARAEEVPRDQPVLILCRSGARSGMAADALRASGYDAYNIDGGILAWEREGLPVERNP